MSKFNLLVPGQEFEAIYKAQVQSMQYLQVHYFTAIVDGFVFDVVVDAVIQNELEVIAFSIMGNHRIAFMVFMDEPLTKFLYGWKIVLFSTNILSNNEIGFVDPCFLSSFNIKEDVFVTRRL